MSDRFVFGGFVNRPVCWHPDNANASEMAGEMRFIVVIARSGIGHANTAACRKPGRIINNGNKSSWIPAGLQFAKMAAVFCTAYDIYR